jgi:ATP-dependent RNA helicase RhlE
VLPVIERLQGKRGTRALILVPTRELALQIDENLRAYGGQRGIRGAVVIGGVGMEPQSRALREGLEVIIATPGRLNDHLERGSARLSGIEILVLDEADRMLDMGFKPQLERILKHLPAQRQSLLFSATMAGEVAEFTERHLREPVRVEIARSGTVAPRAEQRVFQVAQDEKTALLLALLAQDEASVLVFTRTRRRADKLARAVGREGYEVDCIHADRSQGQRRRALDGFRGGEVRILIATDIAARGIDVEEIGHVVNFDLPHVPADYVHRIGRTARAAASGMASSFCSPEERGLWRDIERFIRQSVPSTPVPRDAAAFRVRHTERLARPTNPGGAPGPSAPQRPPGQPPGRHARTHPKRPKPGIAGGAFEAASEPRGHKAKRPEAPPPGKPAGADRRPGWKTRRRRRRQASLPA